MPGTPRPEPVSTKQQRIAELARNCRDMAFTTLAVLMVPYSHCGNRT